LFLAKACNYSIDEQASCEIKAESAISSHSAALIVPLKEKCMKQLLIIGTAIVAMCSFTSSQPSDSINNHEAFGTGENLKYLLYYGWLHGGEASLSVEEQEFEGENVYHAEAKAYTIGWADRVYNVDDVYESYFDKQDGKPVKAIRSIAENSYRYYNEVLFNHEDSSVVSLKSGKKKVPVNIFDMVSAFYYSRNQLFSNVSIGDTVSFVTYFEDEIYPIEVRYRGKEIIETKAGEFEAMKFSPIVEVGRIFDTEDDMTFWVSSDENFIPLRVQFDLFVGSLKCDLIQYSGLKHKLSKLD